MDDWETLMAIAFVSALSIMFMVSVSAGGLMIQRRYYTANWQGLRHTFLGSGQLEEAGAWTRGFVRDSPGSSILLFDLKCEKQAILVRESNILAWLHVVRPRSIRIPWDALRDARIARVPLLKAGLWVTWIEAVIDGTQVSILLPRDMWQEASKAMEAEDGTRGGLAAGA